MYSHRTSPDKRAFTLNGNAVSMIFTASLRNGAYQEHQSVVASIRGHYRIHQEPPVEKTQTAKVNHHLHYASVRYRTTSGPALWFSSQFALRFVRPTDGLGSCRLHPGVCSGSKTHVQCRTGIRTPVAAVKGPFKGYGRPLTPRSPPASTSIADGGTARQIDDAEAERIYEKTATQSSPTRSWRAASAHRPASR